MHFTALTYNIHSARDRKKKPSFEKIVATLRSSQAQLIALQEVDRGCPRSGQRDQAADLADALNMTPVFFEAVNWQKFLYGSESLGQYGQTFLFSSEFTMLGSNQFPLPLISERAEPRIVSTIDLASDGVTLRFYNTHLSTDTRNRRLQLQALADIVDAAPESLPSVLMGDFNMTTAAPLAKAFPAYRECIPVKRPVATFPCRMPVFRLDRILHSAALVSSGTEVIASKVARSASDHLPLKTTLSQR